MAQISDRNKIRDKIFNLGFMILVVITMIKTTTFLTDLFMIGSFRFTWFWVNHSIQLILTLGIMYLLTGVNSFSKWGINCKNKETTFRIIKKFSAGWIICTTIYFMIISFLFGQTDLIGFPLTFKNTIIYLLFESILVGISEEIFFRGLVYEILKKQFIKTQRLSGFSVSEAGIISALIFAFAHIGFTLFPFTITDFNILQIITAFCLGLFYAVIREKTGSLLGSILAHNISDGWISILFILIQLFNKGN